LSAVSETGVCQVTEAFRPWVVTVAMALSNQGPLVIRHFSGGLAAPASFATSRVGPPPTLRQASWLAHLNAPLSGLRNGEQTT
jgi:hypothetical protein